MIDMKSHASILGKVQRYSCFALTGAIKSTLQASLEIIVMLLLLNNISGKSALRLKESEELNHPHIGNYLGYGD